MASPSILTATYRLTPTSSTTKWRKNPDGLTSIFVGDNSMVAQMDDLINTYTDSSNGIITLRQQNIDDQMSKIQDEGDQLTDTYNANYDRYLEEYTNTLVEVYTMKASMAAFA
ncbi:lateral flagellar hook associated protein 2 (FliD-like) [Escherichia coli]|uniref:Lateral flagellar hook associated protein 2 (FliD-like) n=1 Tax=Escherichia coli TaxID=562 RepID=A0A377DG76_ECOLX|nr:lateral flagellar hook associated protein 2 (FliD-like) [Escherichia coli]